ncbi:hypothetical protein MKX03_003253 [Papaver bracteatum]|nr:hypothetical protein MKX03_003253 [Papaver bracteatum]
MEIKGDLGYMIKLVRAIVAVLVFWVAVEIWCDFGGWEMVMVAIESRNENDGANLCISFNVFFHIFIVHYFVRILK